MPRPTRCSGAGSGGRCADGLRRGSTGERISDGRDVRGVRTLAASALDGGMGDAAVSGVVCVDDAIVVAVAIDEAIPETGASSSRRRGARQLKEPMSDDAGFLERGERGGCGAPCVRASRG